jgi:hypothetical protein
VDIERLRLRCRADVVCVLISLVVMGADSVNAVLFQSTGDPSYNTSVPSGTLTNSGWQYQGIWNTTKSIGTNDFPFAKSLGTPIAPRLFISATHVLGTTNDVFVFNGLTYHPVAYFLTLDSDLTIWQVAETFPFYAPLYTASDESNKHVVVFGRGTLRGGPVVVSGQTNGWQWVEPSDGVERWGENDVSSIANGGAGVGDLLRCTFNAGAGSNECALSDGDSGGGLFIQDGGVWKLAGINYEVDGPFSLDGTTNTQFSASLLDARGFYQEVALDVWQLISGPQPILSGFCSTRISANLDWINSVINFEPAGDLQIVGIQVVGNDVQVSFNTSNRLYYVQSNTNLTSGTWTTFTNNVPGTGGIVSVLDTNAAGLPSRFYRVGLAQ